MHSNSKSVKNENFFLFCKFEELKTVNFNLRTKREDPKFKGSKIYLSYKKQFELTC